MLSWGKFQTKDTERPKRSNCRFWSKSGDFPGRSSGYDFTLSMHGAWVQSLVGELRAHVLLSQKKKKTPSKQNKQTQKTNKTKN